MNPGAAPRLERSCVAAGDWFRVAPSLPGLERVEACFAGHAFAPHRHDTYGIGYTVHGVQVFRYRGATRRSHPGQLFVLHPDELHDGRAGTEAGFRYRILYVAPRLIAEALGRPARPLPFVHDVVSRDPRLAAAVGSALADLALPLDDLLRDQILLDLAGALAAADGSIRPGPASRPDSQAVERARQCLDAGFARAVTAAELEAASGLDRYALARQFRACLGTSPYRYLRFRRLDRARKLIGRGLPLAEAAVASGFADQSHMTRQFKSAFGLPPGRWAAMQG